MLEADGSTILIDTPPELRLQPISSGCIDAVVYTHEHADHINGIDDLRVFSVRQGRPLPLYGPGETLDRPGRHSTTSSTIRSVRTRVPRSRG